MKRRIRLSPEVIADLRELEAEHGAIIPRTLRAATKQLERFGWARNFDDHPLKGQLRGWRAFSLGAQTAESAPRTVYYNADDRYVLLIAAGEHDEAYARALRRRGTGTG